MNVRTEVTKLFCKNEEREPTYTLRIFFSPDETTLIACGQKDGGIAIWRLDSGGFGKPEHIQLLWGHGGFAVQKLSFHPEGDLLASASKRGAVHS